MDLFNSENSSDLQSERLKKAIERNRAKQLKRKSPAPTSSTSVVKKNWNPPSSSSTRTGVAKAHDFDFTERLDRKQSLAGDMAEVSYRPVRPRKTRSTISKKNHAGKPLVRLAWLGMVFLMGRLTFFEGGIIDYFDQKERVASIKESMRELEGLNSGLRKEIRLLKESSSYHKKMIRKHLGMIAPDEFLILFSNQTESLSEL